MTRTDPWTRLATLWPLLAETRHPGTRRQWRPSELTGQQRAERDRRLKHERLTAEVFLEATRAPLHLDVLDILGDLYVNLVSAARDLHVPNARMHMRGPVSDPRPLLALCRDQARALGDGIPVDAAAWAMLHTVEHALGEVYDGQRLAVICPWCHGGVTGRPSWRVRILPPDMPAIVCESGACEPGERMAGTMWRGQPAWPLWEWSWLAGILEADEHREAAPIGG